MESKAPSSVKGYQFSPNKNCHLISEAIFSYYFFFFLQFVLIHLCELLYYPSTENRVFKEIINFKTGDFILVLRIKYLLISVCCKEGDF